MWQQPWTEEAVLHYLNMQGCHVALKVEDSLLEEDASALAQQDAAVKYGGLLSKDALNRYPPYVPGLYVRCSCAARVLLVRCSYTAVALLVCCAARVDGLRTTSAP